MENKDPSARAAASSHTHPIILSASSSHTLRYLPPGSLEVLMYDAVIQYLFNGIVTHHGSIDPGSLHYDN